MKKALPAIFLFVSFFFSSLLAAGQNRLPAASQRSLDDQLWKAIYGVDGSQAVVLLLKKGANIEARAPTFNGDTVLILAALLGKTRTARLLLERGANIEDKDTDGNTPLMMANTEEVAQLLLDKGANIEARNKRGYTPLIWAASEGNPEVVKLLLERGANIEDKDTDGYTPLMMAALWGNTEVVKLLLEKGANIEAKDNLGDTALDAPITSWKKEERIIEMMNLLLAKGANIEAKNTEGETPLMEAALQGQTEVAKLLLENGANIEAKNNQGDTALDLANRNKSMAVADLLEQARRKRKQLEEAQARDPRNIFAANLNAFQQSPKDESLREKVIQLAISLPEPPPIPEEARQMFLLATSQIKQASGPQTLAQPIGLLRKALEIAPWWGNAYYNLSRALEMSGQYDEAMKQLKYYLELKPSEADAQEARAHLVVIQTEKDTATGK